MGWVGNTDRNPPGTRGGHVGGHNGGGGPARKIGAPAPAAPTPGAGAPPGRPPHLAGFAFGGAAPAGGPGAPEGPGGTA